jgi:hypothetical protein
MSRAITKYVQFHQHDPKKVATFAREIVIPATASWVGKAKNVLYRSDKLNPSTGIDEGWIDYIHDHDAGVNTYRFDRGSAAVGVERTVPATHRNADELVWLGQCLGFDYIDHDGGVQVAKGTRPLPDLFCSPSGRCLYIIQSKRTLIAMVWGGKLGVEPRGIVH